MNGKILIDAIMRQTTILIAQLSTTAGIRAPLNDIADQVFLKLSQDIEGQGVTRKVVADMFGLTLRGYQKKVQRITESHTDRGQTLWEALLAYVHEQGSTTRERLFERFAKDDPASIGAVLNDLVGSGLLYKTGGGEGTVYGATREGDYAELLRQRNLEVASALVWLSIYRKPRIQRSEMIDQLGIDAELLERALASLREQGRVRETTGSFSVDTPTIPVGAAQGWEAAVFDHSQAMVTAIATKLRLGAVQSKQSDIIGGATLSFDVHDKHPEREQVYGLLAEVRSKANAIWERVEAYNRANPVSESERTRVVFYFGQSVATEETLDDAAVKPAAPTLREESEG